MNIKKKTYRELNRNELLLLRDEKIRKDFAYYTSSKRNLDSTYVVHEILQMNYFLEIEVLWRIIRGTYKRAYHTNPPKKDIETGNPTLFHK